MKRAKWLRWLGLLCLASAIAFVTVIPSQLLQGYDSGYQHVVSSDETANPYQTPDTSGEDADSVRINLPTDYQQQFLPYVTVDCPNSGTVRKMYANATAIEGLQTSETVPNGTVLVMETYSAQLGTDGRLIPAQLNNVFVREKRDGWQVNEDSGQWRSAWYSPTGRLVSSSQASCISCHTMVRDRDYLFTLPALLKAAKTNQTQYQETEFGTSVCR
ncbi:MAG: cytochrome P460 family protein [Cyanobacteria bacterium P01_D01_bin.156]